MMELFDSRSTIDVSAKIASSLINYNKEDFLLNREFKFIEKCQRSMIVAVQTDQKLLHRRFQNLLQGTEIRHAEFNGDKSRARALRKKWSRGLNTSVGSTERNWDLEDVLRKHYGPKAAAHRQRAMGPNVDNHDIGIFCRCMHDKDIKVIRPHTALLKRNSVPLRDTLSAPPVRRCMRSSWSTVGTQRSTRNTEEAYETISGYNSRGTLGSAPPLRERMEPSERTQFAHEVVEREKLVIGNELQSFHSPPTTTMVVNEDGRHTTACPRILVRSFTGSDQFNIDDVTCTDAFTEVEASPLLTDTLCNDIMMKSCFDNPDTFPGLSIGLKPLCERISVIELKDQYMKHNAKYSAHKYNMNLKIIPGSKPTVEVCSFDYYAERMKNDALVRSRENSVNVLNLKC